MDRLASDRMFTAVMEAGSFAGGAQRLGVSSGQASKLVSRLETDLGAQLLVRTTRALSPTEIGQAYFDRIRGILAEIDALDNAIRHRSGEPTGRLRLSAPASFGVSELAPALLDLMEQYPGLEVDVTFSDRVVNLVDEGFDAAVRIGTVSDQSLLARKLTEARIVLAASPAYLESRGLPTEPSKLARHTCVIDTNFRDPMNWSFRQETDAHPFTIAVTGQLRLSSAEACLAAAERGLGIARIPSFMAGRFLRDGRLRPVLCSFEAAPLPVHVLYPPTRHLAPKVRALIDFLVQRFKGKPQWDEGW